MAARVPEKIALLSGVVCAALGLTVIIGWHWGLTLLVQVRSEYRPMPYGSAASFLLAGLTLIAIVRERERAARYLAAAILIVVTAANTGAVGLDLSFEQLFGLANPGVSPAWFGRMPPNATLNFVLITAALFDITRPRPRWSFVGISGSVVMAIGITALLGYATNLTGAYSWQGLPPMAIHGAAGFIVIGSVLVVASWVRDTSAEDWAPRWAPALIGIAAGTSSLVLWQALLQDGAVTLAVATLSMGVTIASALALSVYFAQTARRELRRAQTVMRQLTAEMAERQRIEQTLRESEDRLRLAIESTELGTWDFNPQTGRLVWSEHVNRHFGRASSGDVTYDTFRAGVHPDDRARIDHLARTAMLPESGGDYQAEFRTIGIDDGQERWVTTRGRVFFDATGRPLRFLGTTLDITEHKRAEASYRESARLLSAFFNSPHSMRAITEVTAANEVTLISANTTGAEFLGLTPDTAHGVALTDVLPQNLRRRWIRAYRQSEARNRPVSLEVAHMRDGRQQWVAAEVTYLGVTSKGHARFANIGEDVTARKLAQRRLQGLQSLAAALSAAVTPDDVSALALQQGVGIMGASVAAVGLVLEDAEQLDVRMSVGIPTLGMLTRTRCALDSRTVVARAARSGERVLVSSRAQYEAEYADGNADFAALDLGAVAGAPLMVDGRVLGAVAYSFSREREFGAEDISFLDAVASLTAQALERARLYRDAERRAAALETANQELAVADRKKDEFLATLAHELRNPLAPIRFALRLLETTVGDSGITRRSLDVVSRQVTQLVRLIDDLLDVSRIARNKIQLRPERVTLSALVHAIVESVTPQMTAGNHRLSVTEHADAALDVDPTRVVQIVTNLLNNAAKFTPPGGDIVLKTEIEGGRAAITVSDTGIGISAEALPHIFDMFHQADKSLTRSAGGLGIGLCLAKQLAEMHGGTITAFSDGPNTGATFRVHLPVADTVTAAIDASHPQAAAQASPGVLSVLIVDDNVDAAETLDLMLRHHGHRTRLAHDGGMAVKAAAESMPQVALLDIGLPVMNGYAVARELRRLYGDGIFLVAITGWGQPEDRRLAREAGFDCHLTKPADPDTVLRILVAVSHRLQCDGCSDCLRTPRTRERDGRAYREMSDATGAL